MMQANSILFRLIIVEAAFRDSVIHTGCHLFGRSMQADNGKRGGERTQIEGKDERVYISVC